MTPQQSQLYEVACAEIMGIICRAISREPYGAENWRFLKDIAEPMIRQKLTALIDSCTPPPPKPPEAGRPANANPGRQSPQPSPPPKKV